MDDLITWLCAQLDDDERVAKRASSQHTWWVLAPGDREIRSGEGIVATTTHPEDARQVARWNPARVLAEVEAKRRILDLHAPQPMNYVDGRYVPGVPTGLQCGYCAGLCHSRSGLGCDSPDAPWPCETVSLLAQPYAGRPGWREEWGVGAAG